ncbi:LysR family transcriptional regulator [Pseudomonas fontis]|uniref:LysR family transcriptional regulator n=1 Tax=Pseudomonas fontis TaxID=2942633 RepID=A0ABT5NXT7_9PSED|nr:LysR family transcriptional regulator [Pseudomonas fontis]MDD0972492.1 LysR family transcriptional regulator [Pseudomonas fontis]MDD0993016.1 LysR family transcriptional regulator [Pseudomonas fontis]
MDRFYEMQIFVTVAQEDGFAAAARRLGISPPTVTRAIASIEQRLGTQLLTRTTRSLHLSEAGQRYLEDCRRILSELEEAEVAAAGSHGVPSGSLTLTAPMLFGELYVAPVLVEYMNQYPAVRLNALLVDRLVNMAEEGVDVAVRIGHLPEGVYKAVKVGQVRQVVCAAPGYLQRHGRPRHPAELETANVVLSSASTLLSDWQFVHQGSAIHVRPTPQLVVTDNKAAINVARLGWGVTRVLSYQVASLLASGELEVLLADFEPPALPIHVVYPQNHQVSAKVRTFVDFLASHLAQHPLLHTAPIERR